MNMLRNWRSRVDWRGRFRRRSRNTSRRCVSLLRNKHRLAGGTVSNVKIFDLAVGTLISNWDKGKKGDYGMGMYAALMKEIEKGLEEIKSRKGMVVEVTRTGKVVSKPFRLFEDQEEPSHLLRAHLSSK